MLIISQTFHNRIVRICKRICFDSHSTGTLSEYRDALWIVTKLSNVGMNPFYSGSHVQEAEVLGLRGIGQL
jgi:hypothetical protein